MCDPSPRRALRKTRKVKRQGVNEWRNGRQYEASGQLMNYILRKVGGFREGKEGGSSPFLNFYEFPQTEGNSLYPEEGGEIVMKGIVTDGVTVDRRGLGDKKDGIFFLHIFVRLVSPNGPTSLRDSTMV